MALIARKKQNKTPTTLPSDFLLSVGKLFNKQFKKEKGDAEFLIYGNIYMDELLFCASLAHPKSLAAASFYLSMDLTKAVSEKPDVVTEKLKAMVDIAASWFAQSLEGGKGIDSVFTAMKDAPNAWESFTWDGAELFVKINRDNHALENAANRILKEAGVSEEDLDEMDDENDDWDDIDPSKLN